MDSCRTALPLRHARLDRAGKNRPRNGFPRGLRASRRRRDRPRSKITGEMPAALRAASVYNARGCVRDTLACRYMTAPLADTCCARLPRESLPWLAPLRACPELRVLL